MYVYDGEDASLIFQFEVGGEFVSPTSATFTARGHNGATIAGLVDVSITLSAGGTDAAIVVPGADNGLAGDTVQNRFVDVKFVYGGNTYRLRQTYSIIAYPLYTATPAKVRSLIGLFDHELSDDEVDLPSAYFAVQDAVTAAVMSTALAATDRTNIRVNDAIALYAALAVLPSLRLRAIQSSTDDNIEVSRFSKTDFDAIEHSLANQYSLSLLELNPTSTTITPTLMVVTNPTDAITGT